MLAIWCMRAYSSDMPREINTQNILEDVSAPQSQEVRATGVCDLKNALHEQPFSSVTFISSYCGLPRVGVPFIPVDMKYRSLNQSDQLLDINFFVSLHDPNEDTVISRGILHGLFGPKEKYPSVTELHSICEFASDNTQAQSSYRMECGNGRLLVEVGAAVGMVGMYAAKRGMRVLAYDAVTTNIQRIEEGRCLNGVRFCTDAHLCGQPASRQSSSSPIDESPTSHENLQNIGTDSALNCSDQSSWGPFSPENFAVGQHLVGYPPDNLAEETDSAQKTYTVVTDPYNLASIAAGGGRMESRATLIRLDDALEGESAIEMLHLAIGSTTHVSLQCSRSPRPSVPSSPSSFPIPPFLPSSYLSDSFALCVSSSLPPPTPSIPSPLSPPLCIDHPSIPNKSAPITRTSARLCAFAPI
jgi:hypothetical protein